MRAAARLSAVALIALAMRLPPALADGAFDFAWRTHPGAQLPLSTALVDEHGQPVTLGRYFTKRPVILVLEYLRCKSLCGVTLRSLVRTLDKLPLEAGRDFELLAVSIDPRDRPADAAAAKAKYVALYRSRTAGAVGIHFLTGAAAAVGHIADTAGFPYRYDPVLDQYVHPAGFVVAAPGGRISRYVLGIGGTPAELAEALGDAEENKALGPFAKILLLCHIKGDVGTYTVPVLAAFAVANLAATAAAFAIFTAVRRKRRR